MRHVLIAAAFAAGASLATTVANAQTYEAGGPARVGNMCQVITDGNTEVGAYGYLTPCAYKAAAEAPARQHRR